MSAPVTKATAEFTLRTTALDVTVAPLVSLWDVAHGGDGWVPPSDDEIAALLPESGLTEEDYIAFPDAELCQPGAPTTHDQVVEEAEAAEGEVS